MLFNCLRKRLDTLKEYTSTHLKRQVIIFVCNQAQFFNKYLHRYIFYAYNNPMVKKNFSLKTYLQWLAQEGTWGDEAISTSVPSCGKPLCPFFSQKQLGPYICGTAFRTSPKLQSWSFTLEASTLLLSVSYGLPMLVIGSFRKQ